MDQAAPLDLSLRKWTGVSPCTGTNGTMTHREETCSRFVGDDRPRAEALRMEVVEEPMVVEEVPRPATPAPAVAPAPRRARVNRMFLNSHEGMLMEHERHHSIRCILAAAHAAVAVVPDTVVLAEVGDPVVASMNVLARVFNSYRDCSARTIYELKKDANTREEALRRERQAEQFFAYFSTAGSHYWGTIGEGSRAPVLDVSEEYATMREQIYDDFTEDSGDSEDDAALAEFLAQ